jgi:lipoprotein-releasing system permease protein
VQRHPQQPDAQGQDAGRGPEAAASREASNVAIGSRLAQNLGARVGQRYYRDQPRRAAPRPSAPFRARSPTYEIAAIFEIGVYDYDKAFVVMPIEDAQILMLMGDQIGMIEVTTTDPTRWPKSLRRCSPKSPTRR